MVVFCRKCGRMIRSGEPRICIPKNRFMPNPTKLILAHSAYEYECWNCDKGKEDDEIYAGARACLGG